MAKASFRLAFFDAKPYDRLFFDGENRKHGIDITYFESRLTPATAPLTAGYDGVCIFVNDEADAKVAETLAANGVKLIALRCAGFNNVDLKRAHELGIPVVRVPQYSPHAVAEYALALLLTLNRRIHRAYNRVREGNFSIHGLMGFDLCGKNVGIVGTGKIGRTFAELLQGFQVNLLAFDPYPDEAAAHALHLRYVSWEELTRESDVISLHCPLTPENRHLINEESIRRMKEGVFLINTSRGQLVDGNALVEGLKSGRIGGAGLDVYEEESEYFFEDRSDKVMLDDVLARLMSFSNVIVTSHQGFFTKEAMQNIAAVTLQSVSDFAANRPLLAALCLNCDGLKNCPGKKNGEKCLPNRRWESCVPSSSGSGARKRGGTFQTK